MTAAQRKALINRPFPLITRHQASYPWGGTIVGDHLTFRPDDDFKEKPITKFLVDIESNNLVEGWEDARVSK